MFCFIEPSCPWKTLGRVALLCFLTVALTGTWIIEQPRSSVLLQHYRLRQLLDTMEASKSVYNLMEERVGYDMSPLYPQSIIFYWFTD